jgi:hypothetical protein
VSSKTRIQSREEIRRRLERLAWLLDSSIPIPGTRFSIGLDALIGLVPFVGDLVGVLLSSAILAEAARLGVGRSTLARMAFNVALEGLVGLIPFAGDVFDAAWKANQRNVRLLGAWLERPVQTQRASLAYILALFALLAALLALCAGLALLALRWLAGL